MRRWMQLRHPIVAAATSCRFSTFDKQQPLPHDMLAILERRMKAVEVRHHQLSQELLQPSISPDDMAKMNKELKKLDAHLSGITTLREKQKEIGELKALLNDSKEDEDMRKLAADEMKAASKEEIEVQHEILLGMLPKDEADNRGCILEVRAGAGGEEASLFAMDLFKMYERYAENNSWTFEVMDINETEVRGYKEASASISGTGAFGKLKFESGVHRVQRVPLTEKGGRTHTSTASVAVLPQADEVDVQLNNDDMRIDTYRAGGAGGQHVNTTSSAVRITHIPSGIVVAIQDERSQHKNKAKALKILRAKLFEMERHKLASSRSELRQEQIGSCDRSERIRTYNFAQGRVTDHRVGMTQHSIEQILQGEGLDAFIDALQMKQEVDALASLRVS